MLLTNVNLLKKIFLTYKNKSKGQELGHNENQGQIINFPKYPSNEVITMNRELKNYSENNENISENDNIFDNVLGQDENLYIRFEKFILENSIGEKLPRVVDIENYLGIGERKRKELNKLANEKGLIIKHKKDKTKWILNINYSER
jgi:hypothetical protein